MTLEAISDRTLVRTRGGSRRYVKLSIEAPAALDARPRPPVNLAVVVDRSGSMGGEKIERARQAASQTLRSLRDGDRLSLVAFDDQIEVLLPSTVVDSRTRRTAGEAVSRLEARGTTNLCEGWLRGCEQVGQYLAEDQVGRALLMSDGLANVGVTDAEVIANHATELRARGVSTSTFGIGVDFDEVLLARMAEAGGGNFYFVETAEQIPDFVASEVGESLDVVARDATIVVRAPEGVSVRSLNGYLVTRESTLWRVALGALVSRQQLDPALEILFPAGSREESITVTLSLDDVDGGLDDGTIDIAYRYAGDRENDRQTRDVEVDRYVASLFASATRREALRLNRDGQYDGARKAMLGCADRIAGYAGDDPELNETLHEMRRGAEQYHEDMTLLARKSAYSASMYSMKMRSAKGASRRDDDRGRIVMLPLLPETRELVKRAVSRAQPALGELFTKVRIGDDLIASFDSAERQGYELSNREEMALVEDAVHAARHPGIRIVTTRRHLEDNWFSHWHEPQRTAVSSLHAWNDTADVSVEAFVVYEILLYGLHALSPRYKVLDIAHEETRGCLFDFCGLRADIEIKLQTMDLCPSCEHRLNNLGIDLTAVKDVCEAVRELARPRPRPRPHSEQRPDL